MLPGTGSGAQLGNTHNGYDVPIQLHPHTGELAALLLRDDPEPGAPGDDRGSSHRTSRSSRDIERLEQQGAEQMGAQGGGQGLWVSPPTLSALREQAKLLHQQKRAKQRQHLTMDVSADRFELAPQLQERQQAADTRSNYQLVGAASEAPTPTNRRGRDGGVLVPLRMMASLLIADGGGEGGGGATAPAARATSGAAGITAAAAGGPGVKAAPHAAGAGLQQQQQQQQQQRQRRQAGQQGPDAGVSGTPSDQPASSPEQAHPGGNTSSDAAAAPPPASLPAEQPPQQPGGACAPAPVPAPAPPVPPHGHAELRPPSPLALPAPAPAPRPDSPSRAVTPSGASPSHRSAGDVEAEEEREREAEDRPRARVGAAPEQRLRAHEPPHSPPALLPPPARSHAAQPARTIPVAWAGPEVEVGPQRLQRASTVSPKASGRGPLSPAPLSAEHAFLEPQPPPRAQPPRPLAQRESLPRSHSNPQTQPHVRGHADFYGSQQQSHQQRQAPHRQQQQPQRRQAHAESPLLGGAAAAAAGGGVVVTAGAMEDDDDADGAMLIDISTADRAAEGALLPTPERPRSAAAAGCGWDELRGLGLASGDAGGGGRGGGGVAATLALLSPGGGKVRGGSAAASRSPDSEWEQQQQQEDERMVEPAEALADAEQEQERERERGLAAAGTGVGPGKGGGGIAEAAGEADEGFDADDEGEAGRAERAHRVLRLKGRTGVARPLPGLAAPSPWASLSAAAPATATAAAAGAPTATDALSLSGFSALSLAPSRTSHGAGPDSEQDLMLEELLKLKVSLRRALLGSTGGGSGGDGDSAAVALVLSLLAALPVSPGALAGSQVAALVSPLRHHSCPQVAAAARHLIADWKAVLKAAARQPASTRLPLAAGGGGGAPVPQLPPRRPPQALARAPPPCAPEPCNADAFEEAVRRPGQPAPSGQKLPPPPPTRGHFDVLAEGAAGGVAIPALHPVQLRMAGATQALQLAASVLQASFPAMRPSSGHSVEFQAELPPPQQQHAEAVVAGDEPLLRPRMHSLPEAELIAEHRRSGNGAARGSGGSGMASVAALSCSPTAARADALEMLPRTRLGSTGASGGARQAASEAGEPAPAPPLTAPRSRSYSPRTLGLGLGGGGGGSEGGGRDGGGGALRGTPGVVAGGVGTPAGPVLPTPVLPHAPGRKRKSERSVSRRGGGNPSKRAAAAGAPGTSTGPRAVPPGLPMTPHGDLTGCAPDDQHRAPLHAAAAAGPGPKPPARATLHGAHAPPLSKRQRPHHSSSGGMGPHGGGGHVTATKIRRMSLLLSNLDLGTDRGGDGDPGDSNGAGGRGDVAGPLQAELEQDADADADMGSQDDEAAMLTSDGEDQGTPASGQHLQHHVAGNGSSANAEMVKAAASGSDGGNGGADSRDGCRSSRRDAEGYQPVPQVRGEPTGMGEGLPRGSGPAAASRPLDPPAAYTSAAWGQTGPSPEPGAPQEARSERLRAGAHVGGPAPRTASGPQGPHAVQSGSAVERRFDPVAGTAGTSANGTSPASPAPTWRTLGSTVAAGPPGVSAQLVG